MDVDPRLVKELTEAMTDLALKDSMPGSANVDLVNALAAKLYQVGWRDRHFLGNKALAAVPDTLLNQLVNRLRSYERNLDNPQADLTGWRAFVRRVERIGDFRCRNSEPSAPR